MGQLSQEELDNGDSNDESTTFNAETQFEFLHSCFSFYRQDFKAWCVCLISDNKRTNVKVAGISVNQSLVVPVTS